MADSSESPRDPARPTKETVGTTELRAAPTGAPMPGAGGTLRLEPGMLLANRYKIGELLGHGGMGVVFEAFDQLAQETVAIKVLREHLHFNAEAKARFLAEARISRTLAHQHVVRVYDVGEADGHHFLTMERLRGQSLRDRIEQYKKDKKKFALDEVLDIGRQLIGALRYANQYIVHRDVKPENVWLSEDDSVKLMDFGIARIFTALRDTRFALGTAYYMAPEQRHDPESVTWRADMYALGVVLYELLTGRPPEGALLPPYRVRKDLPRAVSDAVLVALAPDAAARFASWNELENVLRDADARFEPAKVAMWIGGVAATALVTVLLLNPKTLGTPEAKPAPIVARVEDQTPASDARTEEAATPPAVRTAASEKTIEADMTDPPSVTPPAAATVPEETEKKASEQTVERGGAPMYPSKVIVENKVDAKKHATLVAAVRAGRLVEVLSGEGSAAKADERTVVVGGALMYASKDIVQNISSSKNHTTLVALMKTDGLDETLSGEGPFTVFAPTNTAFEKLPRGTVDSLLRPSNNGPLDKILTYHVIAGKLSAAELARNAKASSNNTTLKTLQGDSLIVSLDDGKMFVSDQNGNKSQITIADINQSNGVIHVVDTVLLPR